jgi:tetraacyldisaccharide 4'-kinase
LRLERQWYTGGWLSALLAPLGWLYCALMALRRSMYRAGWLTQAAVPVPVVVVGNLTVGGTGKTPLTIALVEYLQSQGRRPAVVSRGYVPGAGSSAVPRVVSEGDGRRLPPSECGDEPALMADRLAVPVVVSADRAAAVREAATMGADCVVADDGFQHLALPRRVSFLVVDGERGFGNGRCLPAGPLREPISAAADADAVVVHGGGDPGVGADLRMSLRPRGLRGIQDPASYRSDGWLAGRRVTAVAGIGDPGRFFASLRDLGAEVAERPYPDHHAYTAAEAAAWAEEGVLVTTEKDAVKLAPLGASGWALVVEAVLEPGPAAWLAALPDPAAGSVS